MLWIETETHMQHLTSYVAQRNVWADIFNRPVLDAKNLTPRQMQDLLRSLDADLSPENLTCDGELRGAQLRQKERMLTGAKNDLIKLARANGVVLEMAESWY
jgi:hypothetical protein